MIYFISDTHFGHSNILRFERHEFNNIEEHDNYIISKLKKLSQEDILYHLGDFAFHSPQILEEWKKLKFRKYLIKGNHDKNNRLLKDNFDGIFDYPIYFQKRIVLSHYPVPVSNGMMNLHGHLHSGANLGFLDKENYLNVNVYLNNYEPISLKTIEQKLSKIVPDSYKFQQEWYSKKDIVSPSEILRFDTEKISTLKENSNVLQTQYLNTFEKFIISNWNSSENNIIEHLNSGIQLFSENKYGEPFVEYLNYLKGVKSDNRNSN